MRTVGCVIAIIVLTGACTGSGGEPQDVADRPLLQSCNENGVKVYLPIRQGPAHASHASRSAVDCILNAHTTGEGREAEFVLVGDEAQGSHAIIQTLPDGLVSYYVHIDGDDWAIYEGCADMTFSWFFNVSKCTVP